MWEYHVEAMMMDKLQPERMEPRLNDLGEARWELISIASRGIDYGADLQAGKAAVMKGCLIC